jgi:predicted 3-demethylubiquinone-9 3-methyltransferase (glyoxalase superfamily)
VTTITPMLWLNDTAAQAAAFYATVFDDVTIHTSLSGPDDKAMVVDLTIGNLRFSLLNGGPHFVLNEACSLTISCQTQEEVDYYWNALTADGGEESMCGWLKDKFGISWQVTPVQLIELQTDTDPATAERVRQAMFQMKKIVIADIEAAANAVPA